MVCIAEQVIVNHGEFTVSVVVNDGVLCLCIMVSYIDPVTANHGLLCYASGCESW